MVTDMLNINIRYKLEREHLKLDFNLDACLSGLTLLTGASGSGKTTFLRLIAGLEQADSGFLKLNNTIIEDSNHAIYTASNKRNIVYQFQQANLLTHLTIEKNLTYAYKRSSKDKYAVDEIVDIFSLQDLLSKKPQQLSGGERQRVAIAQALLSHPTLLLLDEPVSALDQDNKQKVIKAINTLIAHYPLPIIYVTHQADEISHLCQQHFHLENGNITQQKTTHLSSSERYLRHMPVIGEEGQKRLLNSRVLCIGAGGLASGVLPYLAASGVGTIGIVDGDKIELSNLQRQILYKEEQLGQSKAVCAKQYIHKLNSDIHVNCYAYFLDANNIHEIIQDYDVLIDATDNFKTRYILNQASKVKGIPFVSASIYQFEAQISVFNYKKGPCYECLYPAPPAPGSTPNCSQAGVLGVLPGIIGGIQCNETLKILLDKGNVLSAKLLYVDLLQLSFNEFVLEKHIDCEQQHGKLGDIFMQVKSLTIEEAIQLSQQSDFPYTLIDVREKHERDHDHIGGLHIPMSAFDVNAIPKGQALLIYCHAGIRSRSVAEYLVHLGFDDVTNLEGGISAMRNQDAKGIFSHCNN